MFDKIRIVLVHPSHPGNIGSAARAMKTMGFHDLVLVNPRQFPHPKAIELAAGADDILERARVVTSLEEALADCSLVMGTSVRPRAVGMPALTAREAAAVVSTKVAHHSIAIVFGREHAGLTNEELALSHYHIYIPASIEYNSLNLAQAVQVVCYELRVAFADQALSSFQEKSSELATMTEVAGFYEHLTRTLSELKFYKPGHSKRLLPRLMRLFNRVQLEKMEVNILRGILSAIETKLGQPKNSS